MVIDAFYELEILDRSLNIEQRGGTKIAHLSHSMYRTTHPCDRKFFKLKFAVYISQGCVISYVTYDKVGAYLDMIHRIP